MPMACAGHLPHVVPTTTMRPMRSFGRLLQLISLVALPAAMAVQLFGGLRPAQLLVALVCGATCFYLGRMIEGYSAGGSPERNKVTKK